MSELDALFRKRIGFSESEQISFDTLNHVLEKTARTIPFENLRIIQNRTTAITRENLTEKILARGEGGLCYELNPLLYLFLVEHGFDAVLALGVVYKHDEQRFQSIGSTHVTILCTYEGQMYVIDTGFGGNLPLMPVPLSGETVSSANGEFRIRKVDTEHGDYALEMKLRHKDTDWRVGYAFNSTRTITDVEACDAVRTIIEQHPESPFNKHPLITKLTDRGSVTLTNRSITQWTDGQVTKENIESARFNELVEQHFGNSFVRIDDTLSR